MACHSFPLQFLCFLVLSLLEPFPTPLFLQEAFNILKFILCAILCHSTHAEVRGQFGGFNSSVWVMGIKFMMLGLTTGAIALLGYLTRPLRLFYQDCFRS